MIKKLKRINRKLTEELKDLKETVKKLEELEK